jgi:hypothetical protein
LSTTLGGSKSTSVRARSIWSIEDPASALGRSGFEFTISITIASFSGARLIRGNDCKDPLTGKHFLVVFALISGFQYNTHVDSGHKKTLSADSVIRSTVLTMYEIEFPETEKPRICWTLVGLEAATDLSVAFWKKEIAAGRIPFSKAGTKTVIMDEDAREYFIKNRRVHQKAA